MDNGQSSSPPKLSTRFSAAKAAQKADLVALNLRVPFQTRQRLKALALARGVTMTELMLAAVEDYVRDD